MPLDPEAFVEARREADLDRKTITANKRQRVVEDDSKVAKGASTSAKLATHQGWFDIFAMPNHAVVLMHAGSSEES